MIKPVDIGGRTLGWNAMDLEKSTHLHLLYDFYQGLLTEKQRLFFELYHEDDLSLGEIAEEHQVSRQAIYEHVKRSEEMLASYEATLGLLAKHTERKRMFDEIGLLLDRLEAGAEASEKAIIEQIRQEFDKILALD
jgi:hypothetical protein